MVHFCCINIADNIFKLFVQICIIVLVNFRYQILTKRPERMGALVKRKIADVLPNVWLGTSIENEEVVERVDLVRDVMGRAFFEDELVIPYVRHQRVGNRLDRLGRGQGNEMPA